LAHHVQATVQDLFQLVSVLDLLTIYHVLKSVPNWIIHCLAGNLTIILSTIQFFFQFVKFLLTTDPQQSEMPCLHAGDVTDDVQALLAT